MSERVQLCAIVGGGLAGFVAYETLVWGGVRPDEIDVFATDADPAATWRVRAASIRQQRMRSESDGHCLPTSFPGLAVRTARRSRSLTPLALSVCNRYHPTVDEFLEHVAELRERSRWDDQLRLERVERVQAVEDGFALVSAHGGGTYRHVLIAPGHAGLAVPEELVGDSRVVHAYEPHEYADVVAVVGAGMAAATEWLNALAVGARVVSVRRREPERRPLNVERSLFSRRGLVKFHGAEPDARAEVLRRALAPSYPPGRRWDEPLERARREGRFCVQPRVHAEPQVICATGFRRGYAQNPLLAQIVSEHRLDVHETWIALAPDCTVPAVTNAERTLALAGAPAQWAYPAADTLVGAKYAARSFLRRVRACRTR